MIADSTLRELGVGGGFELRLGVPMDQNFIFATWLRSYKHSSQFARRVPDRLFYKFHQAAIARMVFRDGDDSVGSGVHRSAIIRADIHARMERAFTRERIQSLAKTVRDMT